MDKHETAKLKGIGIIMIVIYHIHYDIFGGIFLMDKAAGLSNWIVKVQGYLEYLKVNPLEVVPGFLYIGVHIFFIVSGYGLTKKFFTGKKFDFKSWRKQILKILIPYWIALPITHVLNYILNLVLVSAHVRTIMPGFFDVYTPQQYLESILVPTRWFSQRLALNFVGTWWFVGVILQFYLLLPLLLLILKKLKPLKFIIVAVAITFIYRYFVSYFSDAGTVGLEQANIFLLVNFPARLSEFALGIWLATRKDLRLFKWQLLPGLGLIAAGVASSAYRFGMIWNDFLIGLGFILIFPALLSVLKNKAGDTLKLIGNQSYLIFLYHEPALQLILFLLVPR
jgi:peptidoglycan/LPS O-acetylase OafA/YrhL